jgi:hypothetical protein
MPAPFPAWPSSERMVNGQPGLVAQLDGATMAVLAFDVADHRIQRIWTVLNPEKLPPWPPNRAASPSPVEGSKR